MKRVLVITYYWPPSGGSGVQRWVKFAKYLPLHGWQPVIYTPENPEISLADQSLEKDIPAEAEIIRTRIFEPYQAYRKLSGKKASGEVNPISSGQKSLPKRFALWVRANLFVPDPRISWVRPSVKFLKKYLMEHPVDVIVSTGPPHSMHLIARKLSKATGTPWVADFRDPWTRMFFFKHLPLSPMARKKQFRLEHKVLSDATAIISVSPLVAQDFCEMTDTPVHLITNGYDAEDYEALSGPAVQETFNIVHTGLFAANGNPVALWEVLAEKCAGDEEFAASLRITLAGKTDSEIIESICKCGLKEKLENRGYLPHGETVRCQKNATLLILPLRKEPEYRSVLPGKIFEYLAARRPVLQIGEPSGAAADVISSCAAGVCADWADKETLRSFVDECWEKYSAGADMTTKGNIEKYSRTAVTDQLAALLDCITLKNE